MLPHFAGEAVELLLLHPDLPLEGGLGGGGFASLIVVAGGVG